MLACLNDFCSLNVLELVLYIASACSWLKRLQSNPLGLSKLCLQEGFVFATDRRGNTELESREAGCTSMALTELSWYYWVTKEYLSLTGIKVKVSVPKSSLTKPCPRERSLKFTLRTNLQKCISKIRVGYWTDFYSLDEATVTTHLTRFQIENLKSCV